MNIKGHAVVELRNVETGETQRVEHDNMITNGLKYALTPWCGKFSFANTKNNTLQILTDENSDTRQQNNASIMNHLLGGIFLFQNSLEENVENVAFPLDNPLTGKASSNTYNGMDTYRGSYNKTESGMQDDGSYKHVWDFATNQANGQISALALTTERGGVCGCGYKEWNYDTETEIAAAPLLELGNIKISNGDTLYVSFTNPKTNEIYYLKNLYNVSWGSDAANKDLHLSNTQKLTLIKKKFPLRQLSPFYDYYNQYLVEEVEIPVPEEFTTYAKGFSCIGKTTDNYCYIFRNPSISSIKPEDEMKFLRIKKDDLTVDVISIVNNTPYYLYIDQYRGCFTDSAVIMFGGGIDGGAQGAYLYKIDLKSNDVLTVDLRMKTYYSTIRMEIINGYVYVYNSNNSHSPTKCVNTETLEVRDHTYMAVATYAREIERITPNIFLWLEHYAQYNSTYDYARIELLANTLMTINNLPSPIVKTAAQTMKVTYTITESE